MRLVGREKGRNCAKLWGISQYAIDLEVNGIPYQFVPYTLFLFASALMTLALAVYGMRHRHVPGTDILALCMMIGTLWSVSNVFEVSAMTMEHKLFWANLQYIAYSLGPVAWFLTSCQFTGRAHWIQWKTVLPLFIIPALTIFLVWFDPVWGLVRTNLTLNTVGPIYVLDKQYGPWFLVHFAQSYALNFASIFLAGQAALNKNSIYRGQALFLLGGIGLVVISNLLYVLGVRPVSHDITPLVFSVASGLMFWAIYRFDLFSLVPIAWERVLEAMETGVVVVDESGRVVDLNPAFSRMFGSKDGIGMLLEDISPELASLERKSGTDQHLEMKHRIQEQENFYDVSVSIVTDRLSRVRGKVMVITDITALKLAQARLSLEQQELAIAQERTRFTQDLHDNLGQALAFSSLQVRAICRELDRGNTEKTRTYTHRLGEVLHEIQQEMRAYVHGMRAREYENTSLRMLLEKQLQILREHDDFRSEDIVLNLTGEGFSPEEKMQICQIVREALSNILKHSAATSVHVELFPSGLNWILSIVDNGVGFDPNQALHAKQGGSGLAIISERASLLGGKLHISSMPGRTEIRVEFPLTKGDHNDAHYDCR